MADRFISQGEASSDLLACAAFIAERIKSSDGHGEAMNAVVPRYLARGNVDLAAELSNAVEEPFTRDKLLIAVARKCAETDDLDYALQLTDAIEDHAMQAQAKETVALIRAAKKDFDTAFEITDLSSHPDMIYAAIAVEQAADGDWSAAESTLGRISFTTGLVTALLQIAGAQAASGDMSRPVELLDRASVAAADVEHEEEKIRCFCDIGTLFIDLDRRDRAIQSFDAARTLAEQLDNVHRDFFLVNCALGFLHAGSVDMADRALDSVTDKTQMASALLGFARENWQNGERQDAVETLEEAYQILRSQRERETRDSRARDNLHASIAVQFAGFGKSDRATDIALENRNPDEQMAALAQIAQVLTLQNEDELARQTVTLIGENSARVSALMGIADAKREHGDSEAAPKLLKEAVDLAETIEQFGARSNVLSDLAARFAALGQIETSREISLQNLAVIAQIRDQTSQAAALARLADVYASAPLELGEAEKQVMNSLTKKVEW